MYWYFWVIVVALEAVAGAGLVRFWLPDVPAWFISLALLLLLTLTNLISVRSYGEFEFWFASIKVAAIVVFLMLRASTSSACGRESRRALPISRRTAASPRTAYCQS